MHLVRHGEVENPGDVVYADLPGFGLSATGMEQASKARARLSAATVAVLATSPLDRAVETGQVLASDGMPRPVSDDRLTEWRLSDRWAGTAWPAIESAFPGEMTAYLEHPQDLPFTPESLLDVARRMADMVTELAEAARPGPEIVLVSHQDPIQACRLHLTGLKLARLHRSKPGHGSIVSLQREGAAWREVGYWEPDQGRRWPPLGGDG